MQPMNITTPPWDSIGQTWFQIALTAVAQLLDKSIGCEKARDILTEYGFNDIKAEVCTGITLGFSASREARIRNSGQEHPVHDWSFDLDQPSGLCLQLYFLCPRLIEQRAVGPLPE
jgi:hypothetical protein